MQFKNVLKVIPTCCDWQQPVQLQHSSSSWVVVVGNIQADTGVRRIDKKLANHNRRAQFMHPRFLVVAQTKAQNKER